MTDDTRLYCGRWPKCGCGDAGCFEHTAQAGDDCPTCGRKKPRPPREKTADSPETRQFSYHVPADLFDSHKEIFEAASAHWKLDGVPHSRYQTSQRGCVLLLQANPAEEEQAGEVAE